MVSPGATAVASDTAAPTDNFLAFAGGLSGPADR